MIDKVGTLDFRTSNGCDVSLDWSNGYYLNG